MVVQPPSGLQDITPLQGQPIIGATVSAPMDFVRQAGELAKGIEIDYPRTQRTLRIVCFEGPLNVAGSAFDMSMPRLQTVASPA